MDALSRTIYMYMSRIYKGLRFVPIPQPKMQLSQRKSHNTINKLLTRLRYRVLTIDESHFGTHRVRGKNYVNSIESFWSFAKRRLAKFNGLTDDRFFLHLKETQLGFNHRDKNFYKT